jgi:hypothetical protein
METIGWDSLWVALGLLALGLLLAVGLHNLIELRQHRGANPKPFSLFRRAPLDAQQEDNHTANTLAPEALAYKDASEAGAFEQTVARADAQADVDAGPEPAGQAQTSSPAGPTRFEVAIQFECLGRMPEAVLDELRTVRRIGSKPVRCIPGPGFHQAWLAIALAGRSGFLNLLELDEFSARCEELAASLELTITSSPLDPSEVVRLARHAEEQLLAIDAQVQFSLVTDRSPSLAAIEKAAKSAGLLAWGEGRFFMPERGSDDVVFSVLPGDQGALLTFLMDLPRVDEPASAWLFMVQAAQSMQQSLGGELVDERNGVLDDKAFAIIARQIQDRERVFLAQGLVPGSDLAKRIFT